MTGSTSRKFATAQGRLKKMERIIKPYSGRLEDLDSPSRGEWVPGDYLGDGVADAPTRSRWINRDEEPITSK
jgi:hypothetical protein